MEFVARETWGALTPRSDLLPLEASRIEGIVVHHTTGPAIEPQRMIAAHDRYHKVTRGWSGGLGYCWLVSADGRIWEGRGWNRGGATGRAWDYRTVSVAFIGDSDKDWPVGAQSALMSVVESVRARYGQHLWVKPHSDFKATGCPGQPLRDWCASEGLGAVTGAVRGSEGNPVAPPGVVDWEALAALFSGLRDHVQRKPLRRWRRNYKPAVIAVQARLNHRGFDAGPTDGVYGRRTAAAVKAFQSTQGYLKPNGRVSAATWDALFIQ